MAAKIITDEQKAQIKEALKDGADTKAVIRRFKVSEATITRLRAQLRADGEAKPESRRQEAQKKIGAIQTMNVGRSVVLCLDVGSATLPEVMAAAADAFHAVRNGFIA